MCGAGREEARELEDEEKQFRVNFSPANVRVSRTENLFMMPLVSFCFTTESLQQKQTEKCTNFSFQICSTWWESQVCVAFYVRREMKTQTEI